MSAASKASKETFQQGLEEAVRLGKSGVQTDNEKAVAELARPRTDLTVRKICDALSKLDLCGDSPNDVAWRKFAIDAMSCFHAEIHCCKKDVWGLEDVEEFEQFSNLFVMFEDGDKELYPTVVFATAVLNKVFASLEWPAKPPTVSRKKQAVAAAASLLDMFDRIDTGRQEAIIKAFSTL